LERFARLGRVGPKQFQDEPVQRVLQVFGDNLGDARVVLGLVRVCGGFGSGRVVDDDVGSRECRLHLCVLALEAFDAALVRVDDVAAFHLVKDGVVTPIDLVAAVDVGREEEPVQPFPERFDFVRRRVRPEHVLFVEVVRVGEGATGVIGWETEVVKVLLDGHDRTERVQVLERVEMRLDLAAQDPDRVGRLEVQLPRQF
jgi:hypothetical protein